MQHDTPLLGRHNPPSRLGPHCGAPSSAPATGSNSGGATEAVRLGPLLPPDARPDELFGLLIPGYTLQCLDELTDAVPHSGGLDWTGRG